MTPDDRLQPLREACERHPELATTLIEMLQMITTGPQPRHQVAHPGHAQGIGYTGRMER